MGGERIGIVFIILIILNLVIFSIDMLDWLVAFGGIGYYVLMSIITFIILGLIKLVSIIIDKTSKK